MSASRVLTIIVFCALVLGVALRFRAVDANEHPHGDVHLDTITLHEFTAHGRWITPLERAAPYRPDPEPGFGYPADQHPPLALLVASALAPLEEDAYAALRLGSLVAGLALIGVVYLAARRLAPRHAGFAAAVVAGSFVLADFAGNGAVYSLHALLAVAATLPLARRGLAAACGSGALIGLAYLTNYQALVFLPAALFAVVAAERGAVASRAAVVRYAGLVCGFAAVAAPWWIRNYVVFGEPTYSVNPFYVKWRYGGTLSLVDDPSGALLLAVDWPGIAGFVGPFVANLIVNARFIASQATLWAAALVPLAAAGVVFALRRRESQKGDAQSAALALFALAHLAIMVLWPACKFRYFVPLVPLVALLAAQGLESTPDRLGKLVRNGVVVVLALVAGELLARGRASDGIVVALALAASMAPLVVSAERRAPVTLAVFLVAQGVLWVAAPTRTTYFDGILIADQFKERAAERRDRARQRDLSALPSELTARGVSRVVADVELAAHAIAQDIHLEVVQVVDLGDAAATERVLRHAVTKLGASAILVEGDDGRTALASMRSFGSSEPLLEGRWHLVRFAP